MLVDHARRAVIFYDESDLRNMVGLNGWADALMLGYDRNARIERSRSSIDPSRLLNPAARFPDYHAVDVAEWLESK